MPPQVANSGGPVLTSPQIYPVFFSNDDATMVASLADFSLNVGGTAYWTAATSEYGVGPAVGHTAIKLAETATGTIDDSVIDTWLAAKFAGKFGFPTPDANTLIIIYYPAGVTITLQGQQSCTVFGGYHKSTTIGGQEVAYAVVPRCGDLTMTTGDASHELAEAATDAHPLVDPAYSQVDDADIVWELVLGGGEVGDMCAQFPAAFTQFPPFKYTVQRIWSNKAALAGHDPCQPELPGEVYFNAAPVLPDMVSVMVQNQPVTIRAVQIPVGTSKTIPVQLFSEAPTGPWTVSAAAVSMQTNLTLSLDKTTGQNGDVLNLTIQVKATAQAGTTEAFIVKSVSSSQTQHGDWFGAITY
jgi:hypothetical protein